MVLVVGSALCFSLFPASATADDASGSLARQALRAQLIVSTSEWIRSNLAFHDRWVMSSSSDVLYGHSQEGKRERARGLELDTHKLQFEQALRT